MPAFPLLWPTIAMAGVIFIVWITLTVQRTRHIMANPPDAETFRTGTNARRYFEPVEMPANNLANLFELPMLFFGLMILLLITELANDIQVVLAWIFVGLRAAHSWIHIVVKNVRLRAPVYWLSCVVLLAMWIGLTVDTLSAADAYWETMATLEAQG